MKVVMGPYLNWYGPYQIAEILLKPYKWFLWSKEAYDVRHIWFKPEFKTHIENIDVWYPIDEKFKKVSHDFGGWLCGPDQKKSWLMKVCTWIHAKRDRKIKVRIDSYDVWSMDSTLSPIILPLLKKLKEVQHGAGFVDDADVPEELRSTSAGPKENDWDVDDNHFKRWDWVLNEMIWAFEQLNDEDNDLQFSSGDMDSLWQSLDKDSKPIGEPHALGERKKNVEGTEYYEIVDGPKHTYKVDYDAMKIHHDRIKNGTRLFGVYFQNLWD
jgi:hypothetical protein